MVRLYLFSFFTCSGGPVGWDIHCKSCHYIDNTPTKGWSDAREACKSRGVDLPTIISAEQNEFIASMVPTGHNHMGWCVDWNLRQADDKLY